MSDIDIIEYKDVAIKDLPDGYYRSQLSKMMVSDDIKVCVVAVRGGVGDWASYCGWPKAIDSFQDIYKSYAGHYTRNVSDPMGVAMYGDKFPEHEARTLFPTVEGVYRR